MGVWLGWLSFRNLCRWYRNACGGWPSQVTIRWG